MLNLRLGEQVGQAVVGQAELESGRLPSAQPISAGFVDIVGFTSLGEQVPPDRLGTVIGGFESSLEDAVEPPVRPAREPGRPPDSVRPSRQRGGLTRGARRRPARATPGLRSAAAASRA